MLPQTLTNFGIQKYNQNQTKFNGVYSRKILPKRKDGAYVMNTDKVKSVGTYWIALYVNGNSIIYFDSFGVEHILKEIKNFIENRYSIYKHTIR